MKLALLLLAACTSTAQPIANHGGAPPTPEQRLEQLLAHGGLDVRCLSFDQSDQYFEVREVHDRPCSGNPDTVPVIGWFRVQGNVIEEFVRSSETWVRVTPAP